MHDMLTYAVRRSRTCKISMKDDETITNSLHIIWTNLTGAHHNSPSGLVKFYTPIDNQQDINKACNQL
jgi:hypothetical protein